MNTETTTRTDDELLADYIHGQLSGVETDALIERLGQEPHLAGRLEFMRASELAEQTILSGVYEEQRLPSVIRLIETTKPETVSEKIAAALAPYFQQTVGIAAAVALLVGLLLGGVIF